MTQLQIGVCLGFVLAIIIWSVISEIRIFILEREVYLLEGKLKNEKDRKPQEILDQRGIANLLDDEYGPRKKD